MGQARERKGRRARASQRIAIAPTKQSTLAEDCEVMVFLKAADGKLNVQFLPRDAEPNQESPALIFAGFLSANLDRLVVESMAAYRQWKQEQAEPAPAVITEPPHRAIVLTDGNLARRMDDVELILPPGYGPVMRDRDEVIVRCFKLLSNGELAILDRKVKKDAVQALRDSGECVMVTAPGDPLVTSEQLEEAIARFKAPGGPVMDSAITFVGEEPGTPEAEGGAG